MSILDFFKKPPEDHGGDTAVIKQKYNYWRIRTFYSMYIGYIFFYFSRKSFSFAMPIMMQQLHLDTSQLGMIASILNLAYGASKFFSGMASDKSNPRYFMSVGLILTGVFNIFFGFSSAWLMFAIFWGLNGWFQGWGWPPCAKLLTHWYSQSERGSWWSIWNTSHNVGGAVIPLLASMLAQNFGWRYAMIVPGIICIMVGLFLLNRLRDTPKSLGLPPIEKFKNDLLEKDSGNLEKNLSMKQILFTYVLTNKYIWLLALSYFFVYVVRQAVNDWTQLFLVQEKGCPMIMAAISIFSFEIGGFFGSLAAGWGSDYLFKGRRGPINILFTCGVLMTLYLMWKTPGSMIVLQHTYAFLIGFFIFGPQMLIGVTATELSHKNAAGTATGFIGWFAYIGAAMAGGPLGALIKRFGWEGYFIIMIICCVIPILALLPMWNIRVRESSE